MKKIVIIPFLLLACVHMQAQQVWDLKKDKNGIKVYTGNQANSEYRCVKVECMVDANFSQLLAMLFDIDKHHEWVYNTKSSELCRKVSDSELIYYSEVTSPWPFSNRDFIAHLVVMEKAPDLLRIESHAEGTYKPCIKNCVRIQNSDSYWNIKSISRNLLQIEYVIRFDPGGSVPAWLINMFITEGPYETFKHLKERVHAPQYQNAHYSFIKE